MQVTDEDRRAAASYFAERARQTFSAPHTPEPHAELLIKTLAAHRLTSERRAYEKAAEVAYTICAKTRHVALGDEIAQAIRALATYPTSNPET